MPGLQFHRLDLHTHTPASKCYLYKDHTEKQIVRAAIEKGLSGIAITDHNTAEWIDQMKLAAQNTELTIFPGVEISMSEGFHLVALFDPTVDQKHVESFLGFIDIKPDEYGHQNAVCKIAVYEVIKKIHERGGLAILAHIDEHKGAFFVHAEKKDNGGIRVPINCSKLFNEANYDAVECVHGKLPDGFDKEHQFHRLPAFYQASDNPDPETPSRHSLHGLGQMYSWFKLDEINIEGLRQCLADPEVRIKLMDAKEGTTYPKIVSLKVGPNGFLRNQSFSFHEGLNSIIGGKGVGKSLAVEFLRFGLCQPPEEKTLLVDHHKKLVARLEPDTQVEIVYETNDGTRFRIERRITSIQRDASPRTEERCDNLSSGEPYKGDIATMLPILAYSQTEVIKIAENKNAQLQLIDKLISPGSFDQEISAIQTRLAENDQKLNSGIQARDRLASIERELDTLNARIDNINKSLDNPLFDSIKEVERRKSLLEQGHQHIETLIQRVESWRSQIPGRVTFPSTGQLDIDPALKKVYGFAASAHKDVTKVINALVDMLKAHETEANEIIMTWMPTYDDLERRYKQLLSEIGGDREIREQERQKFERQKREYEKEAQGLQELIDDLQPILSERNGLLDQLECTHHEFYKLRKKKYDELTQLSDGKLRVELEHATDTSTFEEKLIDLLKGGAGALSTNDRRRIAQNIPPRRFVQSVLDRNAAHMANEAEITELWAERVIERLWGTEDFKDVLALQHNYYPADVPSIHFRKQGNVYGELSELSVGQKCTALLIIALCDGTMPVIIDQPEDALDIASVWEDVAKKLRRGKNGRQFILTTHNSSVAVAADSDQFIILDAGATAGRIVASGAIDRPEVRDLVINHLEGGPEPYGLRAQKYHIKQ